VPPLARVLAIGDSVRTDLAGAASFGMDFLFVISGLHADQLGFFGGPDPAEVFAAGAAPSAVIRRLLW
jgi:ribonucleotide monophosphatase NagD (HAD superfamily)